MREDPPDAKDMNSNGDEWGSKYCQVILLGRRGHGFAEGPGDDPIMERIGHGEIREGNIVEGCLFTMTWGGSVP
jgi:hypothetical protein